MPQSWGDTPSPPNLALIGSEWQAQRPRARCQTCGAPVDPRFQLCPACSLEETIRRHPASRSSSWQHRLSAATALHDPGAGTAPNNSGGSDPGAG